MIYSEQNDTKNNNNHQPEVDNRKFSTKMSGGGLFSKASNSKPEKETADLAALVKNRLTNLGMKASDYGKDQGTWWVVYEFVVIYVLVDDQWCFVCDNFFALFYFCIKGQTFYQVVNLGLGSGLCFFFSSSFFGGRGLTNMALK